MKNRFVAFLASLMAMFALVVVPAAPAHAAVPGTWQKCSHWTGHLTVPSYLANSDGRTANISLNSTYRDWGVDFKIDTYAYDSKGNYLWKVDTKTFTTKGNKYWYLDHSVNRGWILSARVTAIISLAPDISCTARDVV